MQVFIGHQGKPELRTTSYDTCHASFKQCLWPFFSVWQGQKYPLLIKSSILQILTKASVNPLYIVWPFRASTCNRVFTTSGYHGSGMSWYKWNPLPRTGRGSKVCCWHTSDSIMSSCFMGWWCQAYLRNRSRCQCLKESQFLSIVAFMEKVLLQMRVR